MYTLALIIIGIVIGWNIPQPAVAKRIQDQIVAWIKNLGIRVNKK